MNEDRQRAYTMQVLAESERLLARAAELKQRHARMLAEHGLDRDTLRQHYEAMPAAQREQLERKVKAIVAEAEEHGRQAVAHAQFNNGPAPRSRRLSQRV